MVKVTSTEQALKGVLSKGQTAPKKAKGKSFYPADSTSRPWKNFLGIARSRRWPGSHAAARRPSASNAALAHLNSCPRITPPRPRRARHLRVVVSTRFPTGVLTELPPRSPRQT